MQIGDVCYGRCPNGKTYTRGIGDENPCSVETPAPTPEPTPEPTPAPTPTPTPPDKYEPGDPRNPLRDFFRICPNGDFVFAWQNCDKTPNSQLLNQFLSRKDVQFGGKVGTGLNALLAAYDTYKTVSTGKEGASALSGYALGVALSQVASQLGWTSFAAAGPMGLAFAAIAAIGASMVNTKEFGDVALRNYWKAIDQGRGFGQALPQELAEGFINFYRTNKNNFGGQAAYGRTGNEDFLYDMTQLINSAVEQGIIRPGASADDIYRSVVKPWLSLMSSGPENEDARRVQDFLMTDIIYNYMLGRPISNAQVKNDSKYKIVSERPMYTGVLPEDMANAPKPNPYTWWKGLPPRFTEGFNFEEWEKSVGGEPPSGGGGLPDNMPEETTEATIEAARGGIIEDYDYMKKKRVRKKKRYQAGGIASLTRDPRMGAAVNPMNGYNFGFAGGGMAAMPEYRAGGKLLRGEGDGMSDSIPAVIRGKSVQRAALADGEFVIPADVVSHLGNGSTEAGAKKLYKMMDQIRRARTGTGKQAPRVNPDKYLPRR